MTEMKSAQACRSISRCSLPSVQSNGKDGLVFPSANNDLNNLASMVMLFWPNALWSGPPGSQSRPVVKEPCSPSFLPWSQVLCDAKGHLSAPS